ncbi:MAG: hypothetical protein IKT68_01065 [Clostridia bacterium]|nr:hypothetical protein [Clostridia bacterium]
MKTTKKILWFVVLPLVLVLSLGLNVYWGLGYKTTYTFEDLVQIAPDQVITVEIKDYETMQKKVITLSQSVKDLMNECDVKYHYSHTETTYDNSGRVVTVTTADGTSGQFVLLEGHIAISNGDSQKVYCPKNGTYLFDTLDWSDATPF